MEDSHPLAPAPLREALAALPVGLRESVADPLNRFPPEFLAKASDHVLSALPRVWAGSEFVTKACVQQPEVLEDLVRSGDLDCAYPPTGHRDRVGARLADCREPEALKAALRHCRLREMLRIAWRDLAGWAELDETLLELSWLAEACIDESLALLHEWQRLQWGTPRDAQGRSQRLVVLGMGKLGGEELNFSSDIDLIFAFSEAGETDGGRSRSNEEYFTRLGRSLIDVLNAPTPQGRVYRVDMRLRPYGDSGPLVMSFAGVEAYYQNQGREWERYAMIKARVVGGDYVAGGALLERLRPFIYRRYLDFSVLESLRGMKALVAREVRRKGIADNVKLGRGGIREIEFVGQAFQLIRGGREQPLQQRRIVPVLRYLGRQGHLPQYVAEELIAAYSFLRRTENRLQALEDSQTHDLPVSSLNRLRLAFAMGFVGWEDFKVALESWRVKVEGHFAQVFAVPQADESEEGDGEEAELADVWTGQLSAENAASVLEQSGYRDGARCAEWLSRLRGGSACRALSGQGRARLDRLMPLILSAGGRVTSPDETLKRLLDLLESIVRRTAYLALLVENPMALSQLVRLCDASPWIARLVARHPLLLDELMDPRSLYSPLKRADLEADLRQRLELLPQSDLEQQMEVLRQFKQTNTLRVAAADISGAVPLMVVSDYLTDIAEVALGEVLELARQHLVARHGIPRASLDGESVEPGFAIVAYGKLGGIELGYGSDLDLVFLHDARGEEQITDGPRPIDNAVFFARLTQRIVHLLATPTGGGILYEVDMRLRPSGRSGLLTSTLDAFAEYQRNKAWTWEHQALVRARVVAGDPALAERFDAVRREIVSRPRDREALRKEVRDMRDRMREELGSGTAELFDIKQDPGGIADIEFMVQYGVLSRAPTCEGLLRYTDNIRLLEALCRTGWISAHDARLLADAYRAYRGRVHQLTLQEREARVDVREFADMRDAVVRLWHRLMEA